MKPRLIIFVALALLVSAAFWRQPAPTELVEAQTSASSTPKRALASTAVKLDSAQTASAALPRAKFAFEDELARFKELHAKVLLTEREQESLELLKNNADLLSALGERLRTAAKTPSDVARQDSAMDLLFEALRDGNRIAAADALRGVVRDGQVEDERLPREARESLAGIKGEVLYQWTSLAPDQKIALVQMLPGPVSRKVWANVQKMQTDHATESLADARTNAQ